MLKKSGCDTVCRLEMMAFCLKLFICFSLNYSFTFGQKEVFGLIVRIWPMSCCLFYFGNTIASENIISFHPCHNGMITKFTGSTI